MYNSYKRFEQINTQNVVLIKKSHRDTYSVDFNVRAICMDDYKDIETLEEFVGFLYGMVAGNHDIDTIFIDGALKQADITLNSLPDFLQKLDKIATTNNIEFFVSVSASKEDIPNIDDPAYKVLC